MKCSLRMETFSILQSAVFSQNSLTEAYTSASSLCMIWSLEWQGVHLTPAGFSAEEIFVKQNTFIFKVICVRIKCIFLCGGMVYKVICKYVYLKIL